MQFRDDRPPSGEPALQPRVPLQASQAGLACKDPSSVSIASANFHIPSRSDTQCRILTSPCSSSPLPLMATSSSEQLPAPYLCRH